MTLGEVLKAVTEATVQVTGCEGAPPDASHVEAFLHAPDPDHSPERVYVSGIHLSNFYANAPQQFDKNSLWQEIEKRLGLPDGQHIAQPTDWDFRTQLGPLALYLYPLV